MLPCVLEAGLEITKYAYILRYTSGIDFRFEPKVPLKKSNKLSQFWKGHITGMYFIDGVCVFYDRSAK